MRHKIKITSYKTVKSREIYPVKIYYTRQRMCKAVNNIWMWRTCLLFKRQIVYKSHTIIIRKIHFTKNEELLHGKIILYQFRVSKWFIGINRIDKKLFLHFIYYIRSTNFFLLLFISINKTLPLFSIEELFASTGNLNHVYNFKSDSVSPFLVKCTFSIREMKMQISNESNFLLLYNIWNNSKNRTDLSQSNRHLPLFRLVGKFTVS